METGGPKYLKRERKSRLGAYNRWRIKTIEDNYKSPGCFYLMDLFVSLRKHSWPSTRVSFLRR